MIDSDDDQAAARKDFFERAKKLSRAEQQYERIAIGVFVKSILTTVAASAIMYGTASFTRPEIIDLAFSNPGGSLAIAFGLTTTIFLLSSMFARMGAATFENENKPNRTVSFKSLFKEGVIKSFELGADFNSAADGEKASARPVEKTEDGPNDYGYGSASQDTYFEQYISEILYSLSAYASSSELTAQRLLDKGVFFMSSGLWFYGGAIVVWQFFANLTKPDTHVMYIGMAACSMTFIVIEFLAAWFFKQYRYYVEVSLSCLRVRSVYDRYLLSYYALGNFSLESELSARDKMMEVLKEDVKWPTYKGAASNDFNYMMESMGAAHTSLEKIRKIFKDSGKGKAQ